MSRAPALTIADLSTVRRVRETRPRVGLVELAKLVADELGRPVSKSALHRFMRVHGIAAGAYGDFPSRGAVAYLAVRAPALAARVTRQEAPPEGMERAVFIGNVSAAFHALLFADAHRAGVPQVAPVAECAEQWLAEAQQ